MKESVKKPEITGFYRLIKGYKIMIKILFICHGNICRSTMAEFVMKDLVQRSGLQDKIYINSAATSTEEIGNGIHPGTMKKLRQVGIQNASHQAVQMRWADYEIYDYLVGMDQWNLRNMLRICGKDPAGKMHLLLDFAGGGEIADPWYTGDFETTYRDVLSGCQGLLERIKENL